MTPHPTVAEVDLAALRHNFREVGKRLAPGCRVMAVVKANAYGHGAVPVARTLLAEGAHGVGVARLEEGVALREGGVDGRVVVLGSVAPGAAERAVEHGLEVVVFEEDTMAALAAAAARRERCVDLHVKVETGMGRLGLAPERVPAFVERLATTPGARLAALMTHFADADGDPEFTVEQMERFTAVRACLAAAGVRIPLAHAANSAGALLAPPSQLDMVRPGIVLYGYPPAPKLTAGADLRPVLSWTCRVVQVKSQQPGDTISYGRTFTARRPSRVAVLPVGYADGLSRALSNRGAVLLHGKLAPIVGRVCMDMTMVDVSDHDGVTVGDEAVIIGRQGEATITADDIAALTGTISYEVLCGIGARVPRTYRDGGV